MPPQARFAASRGKPPTGRYVEPTSVCVLTEARELLRQSLAPAGNSAAFEQQIRGRALRPRTPEKTFAGEQFCSLCEEGRRSAFPHAAARASVGSSRFHRSTKTWSTLRPRTSTRTQRMQPANRQVYTPINCGSARLEGRDIASPPEGSRGQEALAAFSKPDEAERLLTAAQRACPRVRRLLDAAPLHRACRLSEPFIIKRSEVWLEKSFLHCGMTKNGDPRAVHLPPAAVRALAALPLVTRSVSAGDVTRAPPIGIGASMRKKNACSHSARASGSTSSWRRGSSGGGPQERRDVSTSCAIPTALGCAAMRAWAPGKAPSDRRMEVKSRA